AFYSISPSLSASLPKPVQIANQFGKDDFKTVQSVFLGVPSEKYGFEVPGNNHFKVYRVMDAHFNGIGVTVKDQFNKEPVEGKLSGIDYFANPVSKNNGKIPNPQAHLTWYELDEHGPVINRVVTFGNQFGEKQRWTLGRAVYLLVPSEKKEEGSSMPREYNHFKCYKVLKGHLKERSVDLKDQFDKERVKVNVMKPAYFCNPVSKNKEPIYDKDYHLAFYSIVPVVPVPSVPNSVDIENQFGKEDFQTVQSVYLGVPSKKRSFKIKQ
ncbi:MAG: hypothetical protein GY950_15185, partial [bacterium]|nr:hypothetical protein [bacterium]